MRVKVSGNYYKRNKTKYNCIIRDQCLVKWKNKAENVSGFLHATFDTFDCHCHRPYITVIRVHRLCL